MTAEHVTLPADLDLPFLRHLTAKELIEKCDWFLPSALQSAALDAPQIETDYEDFCFHHGPLVCLVPPPGTTPPKNDTGICRRAALWMLRRQHAERFLPQPALRGTAIEWRSER